MAAVIELRPALREANRRAVIEDSRWLESRGNLIDLTNAVDSEEEREKAHLSMDRWAAKRREEARERTIDQAKRKRVITLDSDEEEEVEPKREKLHPDDDAEPKGDKNDPSKLSDSFKSSPPIHPRNEADLIGEVSDAGESYLEDSDEEAAEEDDGDPEEDEDAEGHPEEDEDEEELNWEDLVDEEDIRTFDTGGADPPMSRSEIEAFDELCRKELREAREAREAGYDADNEHGTSDNI
ncbi:hypothetical protein B0J18DRAFT_102433 [Chaetomium sp. MPI-SDFR-AT-0129]|nr:hypothetical protein B0J18DRAFT_102433 [Chaetomium sp. MPI-SDFR-AT-0129]